MNCKMYRKMYEKNTDIKNRVCRERKTSGRRKNKYHMINHIANQKSKKLTRVESLNKFSDTYIKKLEMEREVLTET